MTMVVIVIEVVMVVVVVVVIVIVQRSPPFSVKPDFMSAFTEIRQQGYPAKTQLANIWFVIKKTLEAVASTAPRLAHDR